MSGQTVAQLQSAFQSCADVAFYAAPSGIPMVKVDNAFATATLCLQGAHLCRFSRKEVSGEGDLLWMSELAEIIPGKAIRGGVPVCWPWFGAHTSQSDLPSHGFARNMLWQLHQCRHLDDGATELVLQLCDDATTHALWPHRFQLSLTVTIGEQLTLALTTVNCDNQPFVVGGALHTYFAVADIAKTELVGLDGIYYRDSVTGLDDQLQTGAVKVVAETDRIYQQAPAHCFIDDQGNRRQLHISTQGSETTVVWNPWIDRAIALADFNNDGYHTMLCVEAANCAGNVVTLAPGEQHTLLQHIELHFT